MNQVLIASAVVCALFAGGCDRKPTDNANPKTSIGQSGNPPTQDTRFQGHPHPKSQWI